MSKLYIAEYADVACTEPCLSEQSLELGHASAVSNPLHQHTKAVRLTPDVTCSVAFGVDHPVASESSQKFFAGRSETRLVMPGARLRIAAIANEGDDTGVSFGAIDRALQEKNIQ